MTVTPVVAHDDLGLSLTYSGELHANDHAQAVAIRTATIIKARVGELETNSYLVRCESTGAILLIDAAAHSDYLLALIDHLGGDLQAILTTHRHQDHTGALPEIHAAYPDVPMYASAADADGLPVAPTQLLGQGDTLTVGDVTAAIVALRGHTPCGLGVIVEPHAPVPHAFVGDSLFPGGVGKTNSPEDFSQLLEDVTTRLFDAYPAATIIHPGHGADTTLGDEHGSLAEWAERGW